MELDVALEISFNAFWKSDELSERRSVDFASLEGVARLKGDFLGDCVPPHRARMQIRATMP